jgi:hypothetical protein
MLGGESDLNNTEGNGIYEIGEPFFDTGGDGLFNSEETGYNKDGTENNNQFDGDGEFNDCGEDNCCNADGDLGICVDVGNDNNNIDPNNDNWSVEDSTGTKNEIGQIRMEMANGIQMKVKCGEIGALIGAQIVLKMEVEVV